MIIYNSLFVYDTGDRTGRGRQRDGTRLLHGEGLSRRVLQLRGVPRGAE